MDKDGDIEIRIEETEAEIDAWLSELAVEFEIEEDTIANKIKLDDDIMEIENYEYGDDTLDDNDTSENTLVNHPPMRSG